MEELKNTDKKASAQREKLERPPMEPIIISKQNNPSLAQPN
ncbi:hypothetical protein [Streptococcus oralis]|nr:hypothetical protein [Streptococcus oralis]